MKPTIVALFCGAAALATSVSAFASGDPVRGAQLAKDHTCASCHGADFKSPIDPSYPTRAGQHADYLAHALTSYQRGNKVMSGRANPIMAAQVANLTDQDKADIAAYLSGLPGPLVTRK